MQSSGMRQLVKKAKQFYMLGPNINELPDEFGANYRCTFIKTDFSTVASETHSVPEGGTDVVRLQKLVPKLEGPSLVFSGSVNGARKLSKAVADVHRVAPPSSLLAAAIDWLGINYSSKWGLVKSLKHKVGTHHGKLPRSIAQLLVRLFNEGHLDYLACTSTLIEGVNTAARNVVVVDNKINRKKYDFFTFNNIRGRSGRMWKHFVGHVYLFHDAPEKELQFVDIPVFTQNNNAPDALLVQLDKQDLSEDASRRVRQIWEQNWLSLDTIQKNVGLDPWTQIDLAREIESDLNKYAPLLSWSGIPTYDQLKAVFDLAWRHFKVRSAAGVASASQLTFLVNRYRTTPNYNAQIALAMKGKSGDEADEAMETFLEFARQWMSFKAPRLMSAVNRIQAEVLHRNRRKPGDYAFFCGQMESLFMNPVILALEEYGIPLQLGLRLAPTLGNPETLDKALDALSKRSSFDFRDLSPFERELVKPLCRDGILMPDGSSTLR
jgi:hypothetical protein